MATESNLQRVRHEEGDFRPCHLCSINAYLKWLGSELRIPKQKIEEWLPETFEPQDISRFLSWKPQSKTGQRAKLLMLTLADTGLRSGEALNLRWKDVDLDNCLLSVLRKGRKERKVPFSIELRKVLYKSIPRSVEEFVFGTSAGTRLTRRNAYRNVTNACHSLNIEKPARLLHAFRHSWATNAVKQGMHPFVLQRLLGHTTMDMTNRYVSLGTNDLQKGHISLLADRREALPFIHKREFFRPEFKLSSSSLADSMGLLSGTKSFEI